MTVRDNAKSNVQTGADLVTRATEILNTLPVELLDRPGYIADVRKTVVISSGDVAQDAKDYLPLVGSWDKRVNDYSGDFRITGKVKDSNVSLEFYGQPPLSCTVKVVEEKVTVPEHVVTKRTYQLEGDCFPLMNQP